MNELALKERLKYIAKEQKRTVQEVWKLLLLERFLVRLSHSKYNTQLVFKGGLLLSYYLVIARETTDIDLLARSLQAGKSQIEHILVEICNMQINDHIDMSFDSIEELEHTHMNYPGYRVKINAQFGKMRDRIQVDIGVGDTVDPVQIEWPLFHYKQQPVFEESISLQVYPVETIFAEKLETIIARGAANSRMKDFHDVLLLCRKPIIIDAEKLKKSIRKTFSNRGTPVEVPIVFSEDDYSRLQILWSFHIATLGETVKDALQLPNDILTLMKEINIWLGNMELID